MKEFEELQRLWQKGPSRDPIDFDALMRRIDAGKRGLATQSGWNVLAFLLALILLVFIWVNGEFFTWTSHVALLLITTCLFYAMGIQYKSFRELHSGLAAEFLDRPSEYIAYLKRFRERSYRRHTRNFRIYGFCFAFAMALFSLELYFVVSIGLFIALVLFVVVWFLISYFVFAKSYLENESRKIRALIADLERIQRQME